MRSLIMAIAGLAMATPISAQTPGAEATVRQAVQAFYAAFSHRFDRAADFTTDDWNHINPLGGRTRGRADVLKELAEVHGTFLKGVSDTVERMDVRFANADVAVATVTSRVSTFTTPDGVKHERAAIVLPPTRNRSGGEGRCIVRDADGDAASIGDEIVNAMRNGHADGVRAEVVIVHHAWRVVPPCAGILEVADQFAFLGIHADDGQPLALEAITQIADVQKLLVAIRTGVGGELLLIDTERIAHLLEEPRDGVGTDRDAEVAECHRHFSGRAAGPFHASDGIAGGIVFQQELDQGDDVGGFFFPRVPPATPRPARPLAP